MQTFEQWWEETYTGKLGLPPLELAFKEVACKAWFARTELVAQEVEDKFDFIGGEIVVA